MKKQHILLLIGTVMIVVMISFILYAANHPEATSPYPLSTTYIIYWSYLIVTLCILFYSVILFVKNKKKK